MQKEYRVKTKAYLTVSDKQDYLKGNILNIYEQKCLDGSIFESINIITDDGRVLPCIRE